MCTPLRFNIERIAGFDRHELTLVTEHSLSDLRKARKRRKELSLKLDICAGKIEPDDFRNCTTSLYIAEQAIAAIDYGGEPLTLNTIKSQEALEKVGEILSKYNVSEKPLPDLVRMGSIAEIDKEQYIFGVEERESAEKQGDLIITKTGKVIAMEV